MKTAELGNTYAGRLAMAFAMALSGYDDLFDAPRPKRSVKTLRKQLKAANKRVNDVYAKVPIEEFDAITDEHEYLFSEWEAALDERERILSELEAAGVNPYRDAELWQ